MKNTKLLAGIILFMSVIAFPFWTLPLYASETYQKIIIPESVFKAPKTACTFFHKRKCAVHAQNEAILLLLEVKGEEYAMDPVTPDFVLFKLKEGKIVGEIFFYVSGYDLKNNVKETSLMKSYLTAQGILDDFIKRLQKQKERYWEKIATKDCAGPYPYKKYKNVRWKTKWVFVKDNGALDYFTTESGFLFSLDKKGNLKAIGACYD